jgi:glycosyltransferase involved in cell wall biosynthesis
MKLGVIWEPENSAAHYRAYEPMKAMERRGHEVVWPLDQFGAGVGGRLTGCDVVHVYRRNDEQTLRLMRDLARVGIGVTWDNDDDFRNLPSVHPLYHKMRGRPWRELYERTVQAATIAHRVTVTADRVAELYGQEAVGEIEVIPNMLAAGAIKRGRRHAGIVIGWIAAVEHLADLKKIPLADILGRVVAEHPDVRVECIGVDLSLPERYRHDQFVPFERLTDRIAGFDIGIAPLADLELNEGRSDIKLKEYAARGVPWLASPRGPYVSFGEEQGGRLLADDEWYDALVSMVRDQRGRKRLAKKARRWAKTQTIESTADRWEQHFLEAATAARAARGDRVCMGVG